MDCPLNVDAQSKGRSLRLKVYGLSKLTGPLESKMDEWPDGTTNNIFT